MNHSIFEETIEQVQLPVEIEAMSVYRALEQVQDGRHNRGVRDMRGIDLDADLAGEISGNDQACGDCGVGALTGKVVEAGVAAHAAELPVCSDVQ